ncbi:helix-turn-helix domain-containing protein [Acrocarpospora sp. B8E8]|uniref:helix-turn-helix domain-containing protein n=1 Tax=Acrocarpospora sp. B8E8 TaxID=3153572 RepID=UPI00325C7D71
MTHAAPEPLLTFEEVATYLRMPASRLYDRWREWGVPFFKIGQQLRCDLDDLRAWLVQHRTA